ncbi:unnamed protein product [Effrenium voratum]|nr:unnamed protein product [Effrenium voratum]
MSDRWLKYAAICFHLNFKLAVGISIGAWMSVICYLAATGISAWGGCRYLVLVGVYAPTLLFFLVFFLGHKLSSLAHELPTVWLDKVCIHQTNEAMKALQVNALPVFVARSREILVLWSDTLFERLWCCLELATFAKYGDVESMRFAPLWLAPWLLSSVLLDLASTSLLEVLEILIPNWTSFFMKPLNGFFAEVFHVEEGSRLAGFLAALAIWCLSGLCYLPASIPGCVAFQRKLCNHKLMLEQMSSFDIREAKCSVASDRQLVEDQAPGIDIDQQGPLAESRVSGDAEEALDRFNAYIRGPLQAAVVESIGHEAHVPYYLCVVAFLPMNFYSLVNTLGCDSGHHLKTFLTALCCPVAYAYSYICGDIATRQPRASLTLAGPAATSLAVDAEQLQKLSDELGSSKVEAASMASQALKLGKNLEDASEKAAYWRRRHEEAESAEASSPLQPEEAQERESSEPSDRPRILRVEAEIRSEEELAEALREQMESARFQSEALQEALASAASAAAAFAAEEAQFAARSREEAAEALEAEAESAEEAEAEAEEDLNSVP